MEDRTVSILLRFYFCCCFIFQNFLPCHCVPSLLSFPAFVGTFTMPFSACMCLFLPACLHSLCLFHVPFLVHLFSTFYNFWTADWGRRMEQVAFLPHVFASSPLFVLEGQEQDRRQALWNRTGTLHCTPHLPTFFAPHTAALPFTHTCSLA